MTFRAVPGIGAWGGDARLPDIIPDPLFVNDRQESISIDLNACQVQTRMK